MVFWAALGKLGAGAAKGIAKGAAGAAKGVAKGAVAGAKGVAKATGAPEVYKAAKATAKASKAAGDPKLVTTAKVAGKAITKAKEKGMGGKSTPAEPGSGDKFAGQGPTGLVTTPSKVALIGMKQKGGNPLHYGTHKSGKKCSKSKR